MKKLLKLFLLCLVCFSFASGFSSADSCIRKNLGNNSICVNIEKSSTNRYYLDSDINCRDSSCAVTCSMLLPPDNRLVTLGTCNGSFEYYGNPSGRIKLYITINNDYTEINSYYNFSNGTWGNIIDDDDYYYDDFELSTNDKYPYTYEYVNLTINADRDYVGNISFYKVQYRASTSNNWTNISRTSSSYFSSYSDEWDQGYYKMKSSDNGHKVISNFVKFAKKGYYRIYARDTDGNEDYIDFNVSNSTSYYGNVQISTNNRNPDTSDYIDLTINTDDDYVGKIYLTAKYRSSTSNSRGSISNTSSTYFSDGSTAWKNGYITISTSNRGYKEVYDAFRFAKKGYYRIYATDEQGNQDYIDFNVGNSSSTYNDDLNIYASTTSPSIGSYIKLTIDADENYVGNITFYKVQYRSSTSSSWTNVSRTSSAYFTNYSDEWDQGYYKMKSSDNGHKVISNFVKFAKKGYYRIYARDTDGNEDYIDLNVQTSTTNNDELELRTNDDIPDASEYVDLIILTDDSYRGDINFSAKYRLSTANSWTNISRTSSTYFINRSSTWTNGYVTMTSSDRGEKNVTNIFKFAKKGYYRIIAEDENGNSTYLDFNVGYSNTSPLDGFTQKEFEMIERIYNVWPTLMSKLKSEYPRIRNNTTWKNLSDELYENMGDVIRKKSNREFQDYDDFDSDFRYWFSYTQRLMD